MLNTSGCAFSISSSRITLNGPPPHFLGEKPALLVAHVAGGAPTRRDTLCFSMKSDMSMRTSASGIAEEELGEGLGHEVLPTPVGPRNTKDPSGRLAEDSPVRERRMAEAMTEMASSCPMTFLCSSSSMLEELLRLALHDARQRDARHVGDDLLDVLHVHHVLFHGDRALPALLDLVHLALELADHVAHGRGLLVVLRVHEAGLLQGQPLDLLLQIRELARTDGVLDPAAGSRIRR